MKTMILTLLCFVTFILAITGADRIIKTPEASSKLTASSENAVNSQLLASGKTIQTKLQSKQDYTAELKAITDAKKTVETAWLKAAAEFAKQQAGLESRKADKAALEALETQRKVAVARFNELIRLIDQVEKNQKTALLSEKLNELIVFLEPVASTAAKDEAAKAPSKPLSRGTAPVKEQTTGKK